MSDGVDGAMLATVVAVILTYNRKDLLKNCLQAMARQTRAPDAIVVMNNGSTIEIAVDRVSPAALLLRTAGVLVTVPGTSRNSQGSRGGDR
jgi:hypothetical protein